MPGLRAALAAAAIALATAAAVAAPRFVQAAGAGHTCALDDAGQVWGRGANRLGRLGDGTTDGRRAPVEVRFPDGRGRGWGEIRLTDLQAVRDACPGAGRCGPVREGES